MQCQVFDVPYINLHCCVLLMFATKLPCDVVPNGPFHI